MSGIAFSKCFLSFRKIIEKNASLAEGRRYVGIFVEYSGVAVVVVVVVIVVAVAAVANSHVSSRFRKTYFPNFDGGFFCDIDFVI